MNSTILCHAFGTSFAFALAKLNKTKAKVQLKIANKEEFVNEKSKGPRKIGTSLIIENCSRGEKYIV